MVSDDFHGFFRQLLSYNSGGSSEFQTIYLLAKNKLKYHSTSFKGVKFYMNF